MNQDIVKGHWHEIKGKLKQKWGQLTDDDIAKMDGTAERLQGVLEQRCGFQKDQAKKELDRFLNENNWH